MTAANVRLSNEIFFSIGLLALWGIAGLRDTVECLVSSHILELMNRRLELAKNWYAVYCILNGLLYVVCLFLCIWFIVNRERVATEFITSDLVLQISGLIGIMLIMFAGVCFWLPWSKRNQGMYVVHILNLAFGTGSIIFTPLCVWLLYLFVQKDVQAYYTGRVNNDPSLPRT